MSDLDRVRELRELNDIVVKELQSDERPSVESVGIVWVCADGISEILDDWERDLLSDIADMEADAEASRTRPLTKGKAISGA